MAQEVKFQKGPASTMPTTVVPGTISIQTDLGNMFLDISDGTGNRRIQIKDNTKLPLTGGTLTGNLDLSGNGIININQILDTQGICSITSHGGGAGAGGWGIYGTAEIRGLGGQSIRITGNEDSNKIILGSTNSATSLLIKGVDTPIDNTDAANKQYVDNMIAQVEAGTLNSILFTVCDSSASSSRKDISAPTTEDYTLSVNSYISIMFTNGNSWVASEHTSQPCVVVVNNAPSGNVGYYGIQETYFPFGNLPEYSYVLFKVVSNGTLECMGWLNGVDDGSF